MATTSATVRCENWRRVLRRAIRPYDICVRYAGDEFIVVLSGCGQEEAERKRVGAPAYRGRRWSSKRAPAAGFRSAVSIGAAIYPARRRNL